MRRARARWAGDRRDGRHLGRPWCARAGRGDDITVGLVYSRRRARGRRPLTRPDSPSRASRRTLLMQRRGKIEVNGTLGQDARRISMAYSPVARVPARCRGAERGGVTSRAKRAVVSDGNAVWGSRHCPEAEKPVRMARRCVQGVRGVDAFPLESTRRKSRNRRLRHAARRPSAASHRGHAAPRPVRDRRGCRRSTYGLHETTRHAI